MALNLMMRLIFRIDYYSNAQVSRLSKFFANNSSANIELSKNQLHKIGQSGGFLGKLLVPLLKAGLRLTKNLLTLLAKSVFNTIRINSSGVSNRCSYSKEIFWIGYDYVYNLK